MSKKPQAAMKRPITSLVIFVSFLYVVPSGIFVFLTEGGPPHLKHIAGATHWTASILFLVFTVVHLVLNWKAMKRYMVARASGARAFKKEFALVALVVTTLIVVAGSYELLLF